MLTVLLQYLRTSRGAGGVILKKPKGRQEVFIMIFSASFVCCGEHLVGSGRQKQNASPGLVIRIVEEVPRQPAFFTVFIEQMFEALEFIEYDEVRLQGL